MILFFLTAEGGAQMVNTAVHVWRTVSRSAKASSEPFIFKVTHPNENQIQMT